MSKFVGQVVAIHPVDQPGNVSVPLTALEKAGASVAVTLAGGERCIVDPGARDAPHYIRMLEMLRHAKMPVYLEVDDVAHRINRLLIPGVFRVHGIAQHPVDGRLEVDLRVSHACDFVAVTNPDYHEIVEALRSAQRQKIPVLVTQRPDGPEIIDVRPATFPMFARARASSAELPPVPADPVESTAVTFSQAQRMFDLVNAQSCPTIVTGLACIPFLYPDQGCWSRSHEMCRIMIANGVTPFKVWSYGQRIVSTRNSPVCEVRWSWHTAPMLGDLVIDPSLFEEPVTFADWLARQIAIPPSLPDDFEFTDPTVYLTPRVNDDSVLYDFQYANTAADLSYRRLLLANRCGFTDPPGPPYNCP